MRECTCARCRLCRWPCTLKRLSFTHFPPRAFLLQDFVDNKKLRLVAMVGLYAANSVGDDIEVYTDETRSEVAAKLYGLRQQVRPCCCPGCPALHLSLRLAMVVGPGRPAVRPARRPQPSLACSAAFPAACIAWHGMALPCGLPCGLACPGTLASRQQQPRATSPPLVPCPS